ncbi:MAG: hypothetical protein IKO52_13425 [Clostridia bacterium]|nr:hypothetical protein [Clostridia bacterium]
MLKGIRAFYEKHSVLFIHIFALALWIAINIIGAIVLAVFGMDRLPTELSRIFILLYVMLFSIWLGKKSVDMYKLNQAKEKKTLQILWGIYGVFLLGLVIVLAYNLFITPHSTLHTPN